LLAPFWQRFLPAMERQLQWTRHTRLVLALAGACAVTLHLWVPWRSGLTFVPSAPMGIAPLQRQTVATPARFANTFSDQGGAAWTLGAAGGVLLLCSMATRHGKLRLGRKALPGTRRWQVTCHAFSPAMTCPFPESQQAQNASQSGPGMLSTSATTPCMVSFNVPSAFQTPVVLVELLATMKGEATASNHSQVHSLPAFCINGVRRPRRHTANRHRSSTASAGRTARRSMGARLQLVPEVTCRPALAYDPSRMRTKIQHGLRASTQPGNLARHGECKTPVACNRMVDQSGELFEAHIRLVSNMF